MSLNYLLVQRNSFWDLAKGDRDRLIEVTALIEVKFTVIKGNYFRDFEK